MANIVLLNWFNRFYCTQKQIKITSIIVCQFSLCRNVGDTDCDENILMHVKR